MAHRTWRDSINMFTGVSLQKYGDEGVHRADPEAFQGRKLFSPMELECATFWLGDAVTDSSCLDDVWYVLIYGPFHIDMIINPIYDLFLSLKDRDKGESSKVLNLVSLSAVHAPSRTYQVSPHWNKRCCYHPELSKWFRSTLLGARVRNQMLGQRCPYLSSLSTWCFRNSVSAAWDEEGQRPRAVYCFICTIISSFVQFSLYFAFSFSMRLKIF